MSISINANTTFSSSYYLRNFYSSDRSAAETASYRSNTSNHALVLSDSEAMQKAAKALSSMDCSSSDSTISENVKNGITAFVTSYNNLVESSSSSECSSITSKKKSMANFVKEYESELEAIGISINTNGTLEIDTTALSSASVKKVQKLFTDSTDFCDGIKKYAKDINKYESNQISASNTYSEEDLASALAEALNGSNIDLLL